MSQTVSALAQGLCIASPVCVSSSYDSDTKPVTAEALASMSCAGRNLFLKVAELVSPPCATILCCLLSSWLAPQYLVFFGKHKRHCNCHRQTLNFFLEKIVVARTWQVPKHPGRSKRALAEAAAKKEREEREAAKAASVASGSKSAKSGKKKRK